MGANIIKRPLNNKSILIPILALQLFGALIFSNTDIRYLYGINDPMFYLWRYGSFSLIGFIGGSVCYLIPFEKLNPYFNKPLKLIITFVSLLIYGLYWLDNNFYAMPHKISLWLNPYIDPKGAGYGIIQRLEIFKSAKIFGGVHTGLNGNGTGSFILSHTAQNLGLAMVFLIVISTLILIILMFAACRKTTVQLCKFIAFIIFLYITFSFAQNIAMTFNLLPVTSFHFPFISYNRFTLVFDLCIMGVFIKVTETGANPDSDGRIRCDRL